MANKLLNFDRFMSERKKETITVRVFGEDHQVRASLPATIPIAIARASEMGDNQAMTLALLDALNYWFTEQELRDFAAKGMSFQEVSALAMQLFRMISGKNVDGDDAGKTYDDEDGKTAPGDDDSKK